MDGCRTGLLIDFSPVIAAAKTPSKKVLADLTNARLPVERGPRNIFESKLIDTEISPLLDSSKTISKNGFINSKLDHENNNENNLLDIDTVVYSGARPKETLQKSKGKKKTIHLDSLIPNKDVHVDKRSKDKENTAMEKSKKDCPIPFHLDDCDLLENEEFDFDLEVSPSGSNGFSEDEEVFVGPMGFREKCIQSSKKSIRPLTPLTTEQMAELFREATTIACHISNLSETKSKVIKQDISDEIKMLSLEDSPLHCSFDSEKQLDLEVAKICDSKYKSFPNRQTNDCKSTLNLLQPLQKSIEIKTVESKSTPILNKFASRLTRKESLVPNFSRLSNIKPGNDGIVRFTADKKNGVIKPKAEHQRIHSGQTKLVAPKTKMPAKINIKECNQSPTNPTKRQRLTSFGSDDALSESCSIASDSSESSMASIPHVKKRSLIQAKLEGSHPAHRSNLKPPGSRLQKMEYLPNSFKSANSLSNNSIHSEESVSTGTYKLKAPAYKLKLLQSSKLQKSALTLQKGNPKVVPQTGPVKATFTMSAKTLSELHKTQTCLQDSELSRNINSSIGEMTISSTPIKQQKSQRSKSILNTSLIAQSTPIRTNNEKLRCSTPSTPCNIETKRSCIPTPTRFSYKL